MLYFYCVLSSGFCVLSFSNSRKFVRILTLYGYLQIDQHFAFNINRKDNYTLYIFFWADFYIFSRLMCLVELNKAQCSDMNKARYNSGNLPCSTQKLQETNYKDSRCFTNSNCTFKTADIMRLLPLGKHSARLLDAARAAFWANNLCWLLIVLGWHKGF